MLMSLVCHDTRTAPPAERSRCFIVERGNSSSGRHPSECLCCSWRRQWLKGGEYGKKGKGIWEKAAVLPLPRPRGKLIGGGEEPRSEGFYITGISDTQRLSSHEDWNANESAGSTGTSCSYRPLMLASRQRGVGGRGGGGGGGWGRGAAGGK